MNPDSSNNNRRKERKIDPENSLYRVWLILKNGQIRKHYSFINRNNANKALIYMKNITTRLDVGYGWLIDNQSDELLEVFDITWRQPTEYEFHQFNLNKK